MSRIVLILVCAVILAVLAALGSRLGTGPTPPAERTRAPRQPAAAGSAPQESGWTGRVIDTLGTPVAAAAVRVLAPGGTTAARAVTDAAGGFRFDPAALAETSTIVVLVEHAHFAPRIWRQDPATLAGRARFDDLVLADHAGLLVEVRNEDGTPLEAARVDLRPALCDASLPAAFAAAAASTATSGPDGIAVFYGVAPGPWVVVATASGHAAGGLDHLQPAAPVTSPRATLHLPRGHIVRGRLLDAGGGGVGGATIRFVTAAGMHSVRSEPDGGFRIDGLPDGSHALLVEHPELGVHHREIAVPADQVLPLRLPPGCELEGRVLHGRTKRPVAAATVTARPHAGWSPLRDGHPVHPRATTDGAGIFRFRGLPPGIVTLTASSQDLTATGTSQPLIAGANNPEVILLLEEGFRVTGQVLSPTGLPLPDAAVAVVPHAPSARSGETARPSVQSRVGGRFALEGLHPGRYRLRVRAAGLPPTSSPPFDAVPGKSLELGPIRLKSGRVVAGIAWDAEGRPAAQATVYLRPADRADGLPHHTAHTDSSGRFRFPTVAAGSYRMSYDYPDRQTPAQAAATRAATSVTVALRAAPASGPADHAQDLRPRVR